MYLAHAFQPFDVKQIITMRQEPATTEQPIRDKKVSSDTKQHIWHKLKYMYYIRIHTETQYDHDNPQVVYKTNVYTHIIQLLYHTSVNQVMKVISNESHK